MSLAPVSAQMPNLPNFDPDVYFGYEVGAAGIASVFLDVVQANIYSEETNQIIYNAAIKAMEAIWEKRLVFENESVATWSKGPTFSSSYVYPGLKYGPAGILPVFLEFYEHTGDMKWLQRAEEGYEKLIEQADNDTLSWPYAYGLPKSEGGLALTGLRYGSAGIAEMAVKMYQATGNASYLEDAGTILDYIHSLRRSVTVGSTEYNVPTWYNLPGATYNPILTAYSIGLPGIMKVMVDYAELLNATEAEQTLDLVQEMAVFLGAIQNEDGTWSNEFDNPTAIFYNFEEGLAGVLYALSYVQDHITEDLENYIQKGFDFLHESSISNDTHVGWYARDDKSMNNGLYSGNLGIIDLFIDYLISSDTAIDVEVSDQVEAALNWLITDGSFLTETDAGNDLMYMRMSVENTQFIDISLGAGSTGLIAKLLKYYMMDNIPIEFNVVVKDVMLDLISGVLYFQNPDGLWNRQEVIPEDWESYVITTTNTSDSTASMHYIVLLILPVFARISKRKHKFS